MKMVTGKFVLALLLATGMAGAFARHGADWSGDGTGRRQWQEVADARSDNARMHRGGGNDNSRNGGGGRQFEQQQQPAPNYGVPEEPRRGGRMSPDERRTLRRQIDEAGRDIYAPRR